VNFMVVGYAMQKGFLPKKSRNLFRYLICI